MPPEEIKGDVRVIATGRSDYPNQINNVLAFPGIFRGALSAQATTINEEMNLAAARAIAAVITEDELHEEYVIPSVFNKAVVESVAAAVAEAAIETGVAQRTTRPRPTRRRRSTGSEIVRVQRPSSCGSSLERGTRSRVERQCHVLTASRSAATISSRKALIASQCSVGAYRTPALDFLEPPDAFLAMFDDVHRRAESSAWTVPDQRAPGTQIVVLQPPAA